MTHKSILLSALPLLLFACGKPSVTSDDANDAAGTGAAGLAKNVSGVYLLSTDASYDQPCNYLAEEFVINTFKLEGETIEKVDQPNGCEFRWGTNRVTLIMGNRKPFPSIYHAEYVFDRLYQLSAAKLTTGQAMAGQLQKPALSGPNSEGTGSEMPATNLNSTKRDTSATNDTASTISGRTRQAAIFTEPTVSQLGFVAVPGVGDKAVWEPAKQTIHVLYNNHIMNVMVKTTGSEATKKQQAANLAEVILNQIVEQVR
jgi:hypothetical protein